MKRRVGLGLTLAICAAAEAAEPVAIAPAPAAADVSVPEPTPAATSTAQPGPAKPAKSLNLSLRDVRNYMLPDEYAEALGAPDADQNTVVVEGKRELLPSKSDQPVPGGIMAPFWGLAHPLQIWRLVVPDPKLKLPEYEDREPADKVPPPIFRWGP